MSVAYNECRKVYIWGCGHNSCIFVDQLRLYTDTELTDEYRNWWDKRVAGFIDTNPKRQGQLFKGKMVFSPEQAYDSGIDACIVTVFYRTGIVESLQRYGLRDAQICYWEDFLKACKNDSLKHRDVYCQSYSGSDTLARYLSFSSKIEEKNAESDKTELLGELIKGNDQCKWISAMEWYFGDNIDRASDWLGNCVDKIRHLQNENREKTTIGLLTDRYYGGGIEKVVSMLIPMYLREGFSVVLITEDEDERDYDLPESAGRFLLYEAFDGVIEKRLNRLESCIREKEIDVMVFHTGYTRIQTFYEMLLSKATGAGAVMELHSALRTLFSDRSDISKKLGFMYRMADEMVAVSSLDKELLERLGCKSICIQNPIETFGITSYTELKKKNYFQILWTGRIIQRAKRVFDTVEIMKHVTDKLPDVRLRIIGGIDEPRIYEELCLRIKKAGLEDRIEISHYKKDIMAEYNDADIVLITSESESFSNVLAEAKVMSRPVVMYRLDWLTLAESGRGMIAVDMGDTSAVANEIVNMLNSENRLEKLSVESWESIQPFIAHDIVGDWKKVFERVLAGNTYE